MVPTQEIPEAAKNECKGEWKYEGQFRDELMPDDRRVAFDSKKAVEDIKKQGFHIARFAIIIKTDIIPPPRK